MKQIKIFSSGLPHTLERQVNGWLEDQRLNTSVLFELIDVKFTESNRGFSAMVIYSSTPANAKKSN